ncbi:hypothetical protein KW841_18255 [Pseudomonas sp. PDM28]|jgi:hypothetical protein|uniref:hypothetical protein n=1 Tax=Pseudomonas sp. PDM28 TaxID=2854770 RepID=UPI001C469BDC|nr:hypothetical protein [Pseudomonas sp. PDM28]MBV7554293.1 hypothetical protein [Pseudomonas sp. PDM28]
MDNEINTTENAASEEIHWGAPTILAPRDHTVAPGFIIQAGHVSKPTHWKVEIFNFMLQKVHEYTERTTPYVYYQTPVNLVAPGRSFFFTVKYYRTKEWSSTANSGFIKMGLAKPSINPPSQASTTKPLVFGRGYPGATVKLYEAGYGGVVHGSGVVDANGEWRVQVTEPLRVGDFPMTANQSLDDMVSDWADTVTFVVRP